MYALKPPINSGALIDEVKKRPCLYDGRVAHGDHDKKLAAWGEIGIILFKEKWKGFTPQEKDAIVREMQTKWKSLRDNFSRQLRLQDQGRVLENSKKYIYFDQLEFLAPFYHRRERTSATEESKDSNDDSMFNFEEVKPFNNMTVDPIQISQPVQFIHIQPQPGNVTTASVETPISRNDGEPPSKRVAKVLEELVGMQKEEKTDDAMGNRKFLLSLLPFMKKLPDDVNLEVRLQLMSVLQTYSSGKGFL